MNYRILTIFLAGALTMGVLPAYAAGPVIIGGDDLGSHGGNTGNLVNDICDGDNEDGWLYMQLALADLAAGSEKKGTTVDVLAIGSSPAFEVNEGGKQLCNDSNDAGMALASAADAVKTITFPDGLSFEFCDDEINIDESGPPFAANKIITATTVNGIQDCFDKIKSGDIKPRVIWFPGVDIDNSLTQNEGPVLIANAGAINSFVVSGGGLMSHGGSSDEDTLPLGWLSALLPNIVVNDNSGIEGDPPGHKLTADGNDAFPGLTNNNIDDFSHNWFSGDFGGLDILARNPDDGEDGKKRPYILGGKDTSFFTSPGDVYVVMGTFGNIEPENGSLARANLATALLTQVGDRINLGGGLSGLAIDSTGQFYVTAVGSPTDLIQVNEDGEILRELGTTTFEGKDVKIRDLSFEPETDILFGIGEHDSGVPDFANALFIIDTSDATLQLVTEIDLPKVKGIAFDPRDGKLFAVNNDGDDIPICQLTTITPNTKPTGEQSLVTVLDQCYDGLGIDTDGQIFATTDDTIPLSLHIINPEKGSDVLVAGEETNPSDVDFFYGNPRDEIVEVHCDPITHRYSTSDVVLDEDRVILGGTGDRFENEGDDENECEYTYASGFKETKIVTIAGDFVMSPPGSACNGGNTLFETHVSGTISLKDNFGHTLVLLHEADHCRGDIFLTETPGGTGSVDGDQSTGIFAGTTGAVETHRTIRTLFCEGPCTVEGTIWVDFNPPVVTKSSGSSGHENPSLGRSSDNTRQVGTNCGLAVDRECYNVTQLYHQDFEILQMLTSPHTISNQIYCSQGWQSCNHVIVAFMGMDEWFPTTTMKVEAHKSFDGNWEITWDDPDDYIFDPSDAVPGDITFVPQVIDDKILGTSFTIDFKNKDTGQLKLGIQTRDSLGGVSNTYFNEGVEFIDSDGYPSVDVVYDEPIEVEPLCFGQNNPDRNSCAFAKIKDWATANAEDALRQMMGNQYEYDQ